MCDHLKTLNKHNPESESFLFDVLAEGYKTNYYVAGIDYTKARSRKGSKSNSNSDFLESREIFYELQSLNDDLIVTIVFKRKNEFSKDGLAWKDERIGFNGTVLNYERNANGEDYYLRYNDEYDLMALKYNRYDVEKETVIYFQNLIAIMF